jgi:hypothetical protein
VIFITEYIVFDREEIIKMLNNEPIECVMNSQDNVKVICCSKEYYNSTIWWDDKKSTFKH